MEAVVLVPAFLSLLGLGGMGLLCLVYRQSVEVLAATLLLLPP